MSSGQGSDITNIEMYLNVVRSVNRGIMETTNAIMTHVSNETMRLNRILNEQKVILREIEMKQAAIASSHGQLAQQLRKNTIVVFGLHVPANADLLKFTLKTMRLLLGISINKSDVDNIYMSHVGATPVVKIELMRYLKKQLILKTARDLQLKHVRFVDEHTPRASTCGGRRATDRRSGNKTAVQDSTVGQSGVEKDYGSAESTNGGEEKSEAVLGRSHTSYLFMMICHSFYYLCSVL